MIANKAFESSEWAYERDRECFCILYVFGNAAKISQEEFNWMKIMQCELNLHRNYTRVETV